MAYSLRKCQPLDLNLPPAPALRCANFVELIPTHRPATFMTNTNSCWNYSGKDIQETNITLLRVIPTMTCRVRVVRWMLSTVWNRHCKTHLPSNVGRHGSQWSSIGACCRLSYHAATCHFAIWKILKRPDSPSRNRLSPMDICRSILNMVWTTWLLPREPREDTVFGQPQ